MLLLRSLAAAFISTALVTAATDQIRSSEPRVAALAKEVRTLGWVMFSAPTEAGDWDLFVMRPDGSRLRNVTNTPDVSEMGVRFSPDSKRILYRRIEKDKKIPHDRWGAMGIV